MTLPEPQTAAGRAGLVAVLAEPARALVALDYDGTLAPIVTRPENALPAHGAVAALDALASRVGTVAIITGRPVEQVLDLLGWREHSAGHGRLFVLAQYGLQHYDGRTGEVTTPEPTPGVAEVREALPTLLADAPAGVSVEDKKLALVVHVRQTDDPDAALDALREPLTRLAEEHGLEAHPARRAMELRPPGFDKGGALRRIVDERGAGSVVFAGDDVGDLPAFDAVGELRRRGVPGLAVCSASDEVPELREAADLVVDGPDGAVAFLRELATAIGEP